MPCLECVCRRGCRERRGGGGGVGGGVGEAVGADAWTRSVT